MIAEAKFRIFLILGCCAGAASFCAEVNRCCDDKEEQAQLTVVAILGTDRDKKVDQKLRDIANEVRKKDPKLTGFRIAAMTCKPLPLNNEDSFPLVDDLAAKVRVSRCAKSGRFGLKVSVPSLISGITYTAACGKYLPILTSYRTKKDNDRLIIAVMVKPCGKKD